MKTLNRNDKTKTKALMGLNQNTTLISYMKKKLKIWSSMNNIPYKSYLKSILIPIKITHLSLKPSKIQKPKHTHQKTNPKNQNPWTNIEPLASDPTRARNSNPCNKEKPASDSDREDQHNQSERGGRVRTRKWPFRGTHGGVRRPTGNEIVESRSVHGSGWLGI